jgi:hypothetical protein
VSVAFTIPQCSHERHISSYQRYSPQVPDSRGKAPVQSATIPQLPRLSQTGTPQELDERIVKTTEQVKKGWENQPPLGKIGVSDVIGKRECRFNTSKIDRYKINKLNIISLT